jgi:hypothetical protein
MVPRASSQPSAKQPRIADKPSPAKVSRGVRAGRGSADAYLQECAEHVPARIAPASGYDRGAMSLVNHSAIRYRHGARYPHVLPMLSKYIGEELRSQWGTAVVYLDAQQREAYKLTMRDGKLHDAAGELFDTRSSTLIFRTTNGVYTGTAMFVMDSSGTLYASNTYEEGVFQHSSFLAGGEVAAAGCIDVHDGVVMSISRGSGHYQPAPTHLDQAVDCLKSQGAADFVVDYAL